MQSKAKSIIESQFIEAVYSIASDLMGPSRKNPCGFIIQCNIIIDNKYAYAVTDSHLNITEVYTDKPMTVNATKVDLTDRTINELESLCAILRL